MADYRPSREPRFPGGPGTTGARPEATPDDISTPFDEGVRSVFQELETLLLRKHKDYGPRNIADAPGGPINGLRVRMHDKLARINNLTDSSHKPYYESLEDSFKDMANYAIIGLLVLRDKWDK